MSCRALLRDGFLRLLSFLHCRAEQNRQNPRPWKNIVSSILISLLTAFAFLQSAHAVTRPPDGGYPNFNTAEGTNALQNLTIGLATRLLVGLLFLQPGVGNLNTAIGAGTLLSNTTGSNNTANGALALLFNTTGGFNTAFADSTLINNTEGFGNTATGVSAPQIT